MKNIFFNILSIVSIFGLIVSTLLVYIHFTEDSPGMIMVFLLPSLIGGLLSGLAAIVLKNTKKMVLAKFSKGIHYMNILLMVIGIIILGYMIMN